LPGRYRERVRHGEGASCDPKVVRAGAAKVTFKPGPEPRPLFGHLLVVRQDNVTAERPTNAARPPLTKSGGMDRNEGLTDAGERHGERVTGHQRVEVIPRAFPVQQE
jgi:hypothetical protein